MLHHGQNSKRRNELLLIIVTFGGYLVFGLSENIKGPALPILQSELGINFTQVGLLLSLNSIAYLAAGCFAAPLSRTLGLKLTSILSFMLMTVSGMLIFLSGSFPSLAGSYLCMYIGSGVLQLALAVLGVRIFVHNTSVMMNIAQVTYALSSAAAPIAASLIMGGNGQNLGWRGMYLLILSLGILPLLPALFTRFPDSDLKPVQRPPKRAFLHDPAVWLAAAVLTFAVLTELAMGGWLVNLLQSAYRWSNLAAAGELSAFLIAFAVSRMIFSSVLKKFVTLKSVIAASAAAGVLIIAAVILREQGVVLFAIAGAGVAPAYPVVLSLLAKRYRESSDGAVNLSVTLMGIGMVIGNLLLGFVMDLFQRAYAGKSSTANVITASKVFGLQAGCVMIGCFSVFAAIFAALLLRYIGRHGQAG